RPAVAHRPRRARRDVALRAPPLRLPLIKGARMTDMPEPQPPAAPAYQPSGPSGPRANFGRRFVAALFDGIMLGVVNGILLAALGKGAGYAIGTLISLGYFTYFEGSNSGQTVGKRALGIRVIDFSTGGSIGYGRAAVRWVGRILSFVVC